MSTPILRIVVTDANLLINLMHVSRLGLLAKIPNHDPSTYARSPRSQSDGPRSMLRSGDGWLKVEVISDLGAMTMFTELIAHVGRGEAACIATLHKMARGGKAHEPAVWCGEQAHSGRCHRRRIEEATSLLARSARPVPGTGPRRTDARASTRNGPSGNRLG